MGILLQVLQAGNLIGILAVEGVELATRLRGLLELDDDIQVNITNLAGQAIAADERTMVKINAWRKAKGLPELPLG